MAEAALQIQEPTSDVFGSFHLGDAEFAISALDISDVINAPEAFTKQPLSPTYVLGIFTLRGMTIPVIDLRSMFNVPTTPDETLDQRKVAIIEYEHFHIGILFDQTGEVFRANSPDCEYGAYAEHAGHIVTSGAFRFGKGERIVQRLEARRIIEYGGVPIKPDTDKINANSAKRIASRGPRNQSIVYRVDDCALALNIENVEEIMYVGEIANAALGNELCIGTANVRGKMVPLVNLAAALGLRFELEGIEHRQAILTRSGGKRYALIVDEILDILHYFDDEILQFPLLAVDHAELFDGALTSPAGSEVYRFNIASLLATPSVQEATEGVRDLAHADAEESNEDDTTLDNTLQTYLTFFIDRLYAVQILDIIEVLDYPSDLLQPPLTGGCFDGVLDVRGELISVVNAHHLYGLNGGDTHCSRIIVFDYQSTRFGLAITSIRGISHLRNRDRCPLPSLMLDDQSLVAQDVSEGILVTEQEHRGENLLILDLQAVGERICKSGTERHS